MPERNPWRGGVEETDVTALEIRTLEDKYLPDCFAAETGPDVAYDDWLKVVLKPEWIRLGIFRDEEFSGWIGLERKAADCAELHVSLVRKGLTPLQTRRMMIKAGILMFNHGIERLETCHLQTNKAACRLAKACGMPLEYLLVRNKLPHCVHTLMKQSYLDNPSYWEI